jgi:hypothetical protein
MSKPLWWKNSVKLIKSLTTDDSWASFDSDGWGEFWVRFVYHVKIDGVPAEFEEIMSRPLIESLSEKELFDKIHESFRQQIENYISRLDRASIEGF